MEEKILIARVKDVISRAQNGHVASFGFLSENDSAIAESYLKNSGVCYEFFGGFEGALRSFVCAYPEYLSPAFPITALTFSYRRQNTLSHRDFLGALTGVGIERRAIGDILVEDQRAVVFVSDGICEFVKTQISKVGSVGVDISKGYVLPLPQLSKKIPFSTTIASNRADCVVGALCNFSRNTSAEVITQGLVSINSKTVQKPTQKVFSGDKISIRGKGRFEIESADEFSKKNRVILKYSKYI